VKGTVSFVVEGRPVPLGRGRAVARAVGSSRHVTVYTPKTSKAYKTRVAWEARRALGRMAWDRKGTYAVSILAVMPDRRKVDLDNIAKTVLDGLTGTLWTDDSQVIALDVRKDMSLVRPHLHVTVWPFDEKDPVTLFGWRQLAVECEELLEAIRWMTGSDDFQEGGKARVGFEKGVKPILERYARRV
jgi:Holliday junction resolvase RusA-like endonuclease